MDDLKGLRVVVAGAGAVGQVVALTLLRCGAEVLLADPAPIGDNASGIAAGMLAPVFEALLDPASADHFPWLAVARDAWTGLAESLPGDALIERAGALYLADADELEARAERMKAFDGQSRLLSPAEAAALAPGLRASGPALYSAADWRLEPADMLAALRRAFEAEGGRFVAEAVTGWSGAGARLQSGAQAGAEALVLATGSAGAPWAEAPELGLLSPIKGQILRFPGREPLCGAVVRGAGYYVAPSLRGVMVGATMQPGVSDRTIDAEVVVRLKGAAAALFPALSAAAPLAGAGVRAATPDGLPLVGPSRGGAVMLAVGARRNGWLLAPAMADVVVARLRGVPAGAFGEAFDPARFISG